MKFFIQNYKNNFLLLLLFLIFGCQTDQDDYPAEIDLSGKWKWQTRDKFDFNDKLLESKNMDLIWVITNDSIEQFQAYDLEGQNIMGTIEFSLKWPYKIFPDQTMFIPNNFYQLKNIDKDIFTLTIKRNNYYLEETFYRIE
jgi:hypothetical protein